MEKERLEFRGGWGMAFVPLLIFFIFCVLLFLVFLSYDMHALAMGGFLGLIIGGPLTLWGVLTVRRNTFLRPPGQARLPGRL